MNEGLEYLQSYFVDFEKRRVNDQLEYLQSYFMDSKKKRRENEGLEYIQLYFCDLLFTVKILKIGTP